MHAAQCSFVGTERIVSLHKPGYKAMTAELTLAESSGEETTLVASFLEIDKVCSL